MFNFPAITFIDGNLVVDNGEGMRAAGLEFVHENTILFRETHTAHKSGWVLDHKGKFWDLTPDGKEREWARPLSFLWRFTMSKYKVSEPRPISVGELNHLIEDCVDRYPEAPIVEDLKRYLNGLDSQDEITEEVLRAWPI